MEKVKCPQCGYLNPPEELVCGMCGEVFKKEKAGLGGKKSVQEVPVDEQQAPEKPKKTERHKKYEPEPEPEAEIISEPEPPPAKKPKTSQVPMTDITKGIRNFAQTEEFRNLVKLVAKEAVSESKPEKPPMSPDELKDIVEKKIDAAVPKLLQSDSVLKLVKEEVAKIEPAEGAAPAAQPISDEEIETKIGEILAKSAGRSGGPSLTIEQVELKVNAMIADIREKISCLPDEPIMTFEDMKPVIENHVKEAVSGTAPEVPAEELENSIIAKVKQFLEEQGTKEMPPVVDEEKIASLVEAKLADFSPPAPEAGTAEMDPEALRKSINEALDAKFNSTEFSLLLMDLAREAVQQTEGGGGESAAAVGDEVLNERLKKILPKLLRGDDFQKMIAASIEDTVSIPQISARDVERIVNTRFEILENDLVDSDSFNKKVTRAIEASTVKEQAETPDVDAQVSEKIEALRSELSGLIESGVKEYFSSDDFTGKVSEIAAREAQSAVPEIPELDTSELEGRIASLEEKINVAAEESVAPLKEEVSAIPGLIDDKLEQFRAEMLGSDEIATKISDIARQIAEGTIEAKPSLTKEDISAAWDEKFSAEEVEEKIKTLAGEIVTKAVLDLPEPDTSELEARILAAGMDMQSKLESEEFENRIRSLAVEAAPELDTSEIEAKIEALREEMKTSLEESLAGQLESEALDAKIRILAGQEVQKAAPEIDTSEIDEKIENLRNQIQTVSSEALKPLEEQIEGMPQFIEHKLDEFWKDLLDSEDMDNRVSNIARQVAEETVGSVSSITPEQVEEQVGRAVSETEKKILESDELSSLIGEKVAPLLEKSNEQVQPLIMEKVSHLVTDSINAALAEKFSGEEFARKVRELSEESATEAVKNLPRLTPEDVREISGGQFDKWIETYFKSEDFKEKVTEHIRNVAVEMLRDARSVILEDAEMRTGEQIEARLKMLEMTTPDDLNEKIENLKTYFNNKLEELDSKFANLAEEKVGEKMGEIDEKLEKALSESDEKLREVAMAFEQDIRPFKEKIENLNAELTEKMMPFTQKLGELSGSVETEIPVIKDQLAEIGSSSASTSAELTEKIDKLENDLQANIDTQESRIDALLDEFEKIPTSEKLEEVLASGLEAARAQIEGKVSENLNRMNAKLKETEEKLDKVPKADQASIEKMIINKVGDLPRQVEVFQKRLASLAEESMSSGDGGGVTKEEIIRVIDTHLAEMELGDGFSPEDIASLIMTQLDTQMASIYESDEFKDAVKQYAPVGEGGIDKDEFEEALRAFVKLEIGRTAKSLKEELKQFYDSDEFAGKVKAVAPAGAVGEGGGGVAAPDAKEMLELVKKALDTKEVNLKIAQKFLEVMTYVKSEVPKLVKSEIQKQG